MGKAVEILRKVLCKKRIDEHKISWVTYEVSRRDVVYFHLSTNPLLAFQTGGQQYFFRECPPRQPRQEYVKEQIRRFFSHLGNNQPEKINFAQALPIRIAFEEETVTAFRGYLDSLEQNDAFIRKIGTAYETLCSSGFSIWAEDNRMSSALFAQLGLDALKPEFYDIALYFSWYMRGAMATLDTQKTVSGKDRYYYNAVRTVATEEIARALGVEALVTPSRWCRLVIDGKERYGIASKAAPGIRALDADIRPTGFLQRDLLCLNVLDAICFQQDHGPNNYNIDLTQERTVCAFDNDNPNTFFPINKISWPFSGCSPMVTAEGKLNRPYMDKELYEALRCFDRKCLKASLRPLLNGLQIKSVFTRMKQLQNLLKDACLLAGSEWNGETLQEELSGAYGKTYLCGFAEKAER